MMIPAFNMINWPTQWRSWPKWSWWSYHLAMLIIKPGVDDHFNGNAGWVRLQRGCWSGLQGCAEGFWGSALSLKSVSLASSLLSSSSNFMWSSSSSCWSSKANGARWMLVIVERWSWSWPTSWIGDYKFSWSWSIKVSCQKSKTCDHKYWMNSSINDNPWWLNTTNSQGQGRVGHHRIDRLRSSLHPCPQNSYRDVHCNLEILCWMVRIIIIMKKENDNHENHVNKRCEKIGWGPVPINQLMTW